MRKRAQQKVLSKLGQFINDNPNVDLRVVLDQEEILDSKQNCKIFGEFVTKTPERFWEMLQIINLKQNENEEAIPNKYPFIVSEIIGSKDEQIINYFFDQKGPEEFEFLNFLFKTIDRDFIDNTLAGYVAKILKAIIEKRGLSLWKYLTNSQKESQYVLKDLIKHLDVYHIADIIFNLIRLDTIRQEGEDVYINQRIQLLLRIIEYLQQKNYIGVIVENVSSILQNILTETIENEERAIFIYNILNSLKYDSILISKSSSLIQILIIILDYIQKDNLTRENKFVYNYQLLQEVSYNLLELLNLDLNLPQFKTSYGINQEPLGQFKLQLIEFYFKVLKLNEPYILPCFQHQNICFSMMQLILKHEFNNAIQILFQEITQLVMKNDEYYEIQEQYKTCNIFGFLIHLNSQEKYQVGSIKKLITKGFQGMTNKLSYLLQTDFQDENWQLYIHNQQQIFQNENTYLFGQNPNYVEDTEKENELIQSMTQNVDQNKEINIQQFGQVELPKMEMLIQEVQQPIEQQSSSYQQKQEGQQKIILIQEQKVQEPNTDNIVQQNTNEQWSNLKFGQIVIQPQEEIINPNDQINQSQQFEDEPRNISAEIQQVLISNVDPDYPDKMVVDFYKTKAMSEKNNNSGSLELEKVENRPRRGTQVYTSKQHVPLKRKLSDQTFETEMKIPNRLSYSSKPSNNQIFSPLLQKQFGKDNNQLK